MNAKETNSLQAQDKVFLLDVRSPLEFRQGYLHGSENVPLDQLLEGTPVPDVPEGKQLCLICQSGKRAEKARVFLAERYGWKAEILDGGVNAWREHGYPLEKEAGVHGVTLIRQVQIIIGAVNLAAFLLAWLVSPYWLAVPVLTSAGLLFAGVTGFCGLAVVLQKMPWNRI